VANNEGFKGYLDEARMSIVARASNEMAFTVGGTLNKPSFSANPATNTFLGYGQALIVPTVVIGTLPISFQWQQNGGSGFTNVVGQITNTLLMNNVTFATAGDYRLIATNGLGSATSSVAHVSIGAAFSELFGTGVGTDGNLPTGGAGVFDPHYTLAQSADTANLGPGAVIWDMATAPLKANNGRFANADGVSQWIAPVPPAASPDGIYVYRTQFLIDQTDLSTAILRGTLWVNLSNMDILVNGVSVGGLSAANKSDAADFSFSVSNGLVAGLNTLDFVTTNSASAQDTESAIRVELFGLGQALAPGKPTITDQPVSQTVHDGRLGGQSVATFSVVALGRPPLSYQWWADGAPLTGVTNRTLTFINPTNGAQGTNFSVVVSNDSGSITSHVAVLTILSTNQPPVAPSYTYTVYSNTTLNVSMDTLYLNSSDADHDPLSFSPTTPFDPSSTNGGSITQNGITLTYSPVADYTGADQFNYYLTDGIDTTTGSINIKVVPLLVPSTFSATHSGNNIMLSGGGGTPGGPFHVLSTTDLTTPLANWVSAATGTFDGSGNFNVAQPISSTVPQTFYIIQVP
jgi:Bacterial Ig domain